MKSLLVSVFWPCWEAVKSIAACLPVDRIEELWPDGPQKLELFHITETQAEAPECPDPPRCRLGPISRAT